jgi:hypothetical protein
MNNKKIDKFIEKALKKMFQAVGAQKEYSLDYCKKKKWYMNYSWNGKQIAEYKKWFVKNAVKDLELSDKRAEKEWSYFFLQWGWKQEYENIHSKSIL